MPLPFNDEISLFLLLETLLSAIEINLPSSYCIYSCIRAKKKVEGKGRQPFQQNCGLLAACTRVIFGSNTPDRIVYSVFFTTFNQCCRVDLNP